MFPPCLIMTNGFGGWEFARKEQMSKLDGKSFQRLVSAWRCLDSETLGCRLLE